MSKFFSEATDKFRNSYWLKSGTFTLMSKVSSVLFGFLNFFILIRLLSKDDFGAYVLFFTVSGFLEMIKHGFIRNPLVRFLISADDSEVASVQTASLLLNAIVGVLEVVLLFVFAYTLPQFWDAPQLQSLFFIYMVTTLIFIPVNHFDVVQQARMNFKGTFFSNFTRQFGLAFFIILSFATGFSITLEMIIWAQCLAIAVSVFVSYRFARRYIKLSQTISWTWIKQLFHYGKYTFGTNVSSTFLRSIDSWMLGRMLTPAAVAIFNPAIRVSNLVEVPTDTLTAIVFPKLASRLKANGDLAARHLYEKTVGTLLAIMLPVVLFVIVFAAPIVRLIAGPGFEETIPILQVTMLYGLIIPFNRMVGITLDAVGKASKNFGFTFRNAVINGVSNYIFISQFGIIGAAFGTLFTYLFALVYNQFFLNKYYGIRIQGVFYYTMEFYVRLFSSGVALLRRNFDNDF